ncbi:hypothetical protein [Tardibacter chloracetimidivorans]|uniref:hypothetical protein n=1 Tax=Tardibacter chloracetimidivorans TaxID=1921510 RepID=UPI00130120B7|nr:hypothetical protein [Tardibacter chloracetimidivorans]
MPFSLHRKISGCFSRLTTSLEHVFKPRFRGDCKPDRQLSNEIETRLALRKEQRLSRNDAAKRGAINRQQAEALRRRTHRHELLAGLSKGSEAMRTPENRHQLNMFAELLAQGDTITAASGRLSISRQRGGQLLAKLRRELGWQAQ